MSKSIILTAEQLACLAAPIRAQVVAWLRANEPSTAQEIADGMGAEAKRLHFHLNRLVEAGLVLVVEVRKGRGKPQPVYRAASGSFVLDAADSSEEYQSAVNESVAAMLRLVNREFVAASESGPKPTVVRQSVSLTPENLAIVNQRIGELERFVASLHTPGEGQTVSLTLLVTPAKPKGKRRSHQSG